MNRIDCPRRSTRPLTRNVAIGLGVAGLCAALLGSSHASAQVRPGDAAAAEALFQEGLRLMEQAKLSDACPKLAESQRLDPAVGTLLYLGECYERNGQLASAWATFRSAAAAGRKANQAERERIAARRATELEPRIPKLTIEVPAEANVRGIRVMRDGMEVGPGAWGVAVPVDPGVHVIQVSAPGKKPVTKSLNVDAGAVTFSLSALEDGPAQSDPASTAAGEAPDSKAASPAPKDLGTEALTDSSQHTWGLVLGGVGLGGLAAGAIFAVQANKKEKDSESYCRPDAPSICSQQGVDLLDEASTNTTISWVGFGVGGAALITGTVLYLTAPSAKSESASVRWAPLVGGSGGGLIASGTW